MSAARYAIYYVPSKESAFATFGRTWLGVDIETGEPVKHAKLPGLSVSKIDKLTALPRFYGFHGTLKSPFELAPGATLDKLRETLEIHARGVAPVEIPPLEIAVIGKFLVLSPTESSPALENLAAGIVRSLDAFRRRRTAKELAQYRQAKLTVHQEQMLEHWGYPYVLEEFHFHLTLTSRIDDDAERNETVEILTEACAEFLEKPMELNELALCTQPEQDTYMRIVDRVPLCGSR